MEDHKMKVSQSLTKKSKIDTHSENDVYLPNPLTQHGILIIIHYPFKVLSANSSSSRITGFDLKELKGISEQQFLQHIHPDDREMIGHYFSEMTPTLECSEDTIRIQRKDGTIISINIHLQSVEIADQICTVITMHEIEDLYFLKNVIDSLTHPFYVINTSDYTIRLANEAANLGIISGNETCHKLTHNLQSPCHEKGLSCPLIEVLRTKKPAYVEHEHFDENGNTRFLEVHAYPIFDSDGNITKIIEYDLDITDKRETEVMLELESKRSRLFLDILAHDVANQLQIVWGNVELLRHSGESGWIDSHQKYVDQIENSARKCTELILQVRCAEGLAVAPLADRSLIRAIFECIDDLASKYDNLRISLLIRPSRAVILADMNLERLLFNILDNAAKHNPSDSKSIWIEISNSEGGFEIIISDTGIGISDDNKKVLFDPFHRIGGIGLHLCRTIVEKYGGTLTVRNRIPEKYEHGAEFVIWLPEFGGFE